MKKLFAVLALVAVMTSCKSKKKEEAKPDATTTTTTTPDGTTTTTTTATDGVPTFSDPEVQQYVNDYTTFVNAYVSAYTAKDMSKVAELSSKMSDWSSRSMSVGQKLAGNADEATKFTNYVTKLSQDLTAAMTPPMK